MLNLKQLLVKAAQYFDMNLKELLIKESIQKVRFKTEENSDEKYYKIVDGIFEKIYKLNINKDIEAILYDLMDYYLDIYVALDNKLEGKKDREVNLLVLEKFIIPFLAVRMAEYSIKQADIGPLSDKFWYLPIIDSKGKIKSPINTIMVWLMELYGKTNTEFYEDGPSSISMSTLKSWKNTLVLPDSELIEQVVNFDYKYSGCFLLNLNDSIENQFKLAVEFNRDKYISIEQLKLEVPNTNNFLDRLKSNLLTNEEKKLFISYIATRWSNPPKKLLNDVFMIARASQAAYKELCKYFNVKASDIHGNKPLELIKQYKRVFNSFIAIKNKRDIEHDKIDIASIIMFKQIKYNRKLILHILIADILHCVNTK